jgi:hypothetical protein
MNFYDESGVLLDGINLLDRYFFLPSLLQTYMFGLGCSAPTYLHRKYVGQICFGPSCQQDLKEKEKPVIVQFPNANLFLVAYTIY